MHNGLKPEFLEVLFRGGAEDKDDHTIARKGVHFKQALEFPMY